MKIETLSSILKHKNNNGIVDKMPDIEVFVMIKDENAKYIPCEIGNISADRWGVYIYLARDES